MKKIVLTLFTLGIFFSCQNDDDNSNVALIGDWKLIEVLVDPGDGSGTFNAVESDKIITFESNGTLSSNGSLCDMSVSANNQTSGTYSSSEMTYTSADCNPTNDYFFEQSGNILIISYPCIEPCQAKYIKL